MQCLSLGGNGALPTRGLAALNKSLTASLSFAKRDPTLS
jgi:hypothetical protein